MPENINKKVYSIKSYLITDPSILSNDPIIFEKKLSFILDKYRPDYACFRDKSSQNYEELATLFIKISKSFNIAHIFINTHVHLAHKLQAHGVHLPSHMIKQTAQIKEEYKLDVICSAHDEEEAIQALNLGANAITYSPIFSTPNKGEPKGLEELKGINDKIDIDIFALGGVTTNEHIQKLKKSGVYGFASIRYFNV